MLLADNNNRTSDIHALPGTTEDLLGKDVVNVQAKIKTLEDELEALKKSITIAKGTGDFAEQAAKAVAEANKMEGRAETAAPTPSKPASLAEQVEQCLRREFMTTEQLSRAVGASTEKVLAVIKGARPKVINLGSTDRPRWAWRIGSQAKPSELRDLIERLISYEPMEFRQIVNATGAREGLVQGHMIEIRKVKDVYDMGTPGRARWFMMPDTARPARLERKRGKAKTKAEKNEGKE